jgi:methyl-accepting chemotaxis protein
MLKSGRLLSPGVRLVARCPLAWKFALVGVVFTFCLGWLAVEMVRTQNEVITFADQERAGVAYLGALHGGLQAALAPGPDPGGLALDRLAAVDGQLGIRLGTGDHLRKLRAAWAPAAAGSREDPRAPVLQEILALNSLVGDTSQLILDPDIDSYYVMDMVLLKVPQVQVLVRQMRWLAEAVVREGVLAAGDRTRLVVLSGQAQGLLDGIRDDVRDDKAFSNPSVKARLEGPVVAFLARCDAWLAVIRDRVAGADLSATLVDVEGGERRPIEAGFQLQETASQVLDTLLEARIHQRTVVKARDQTLAAAGILAGFYLFLALYRYMEGEFARLRRLATALEGGDLTQRLQPANRDELGQVALAFDQVAARFAGEFGSFAGIAAQVAAASEQLSASAREVTRTAAGLSRTAQQQHGANRSVGEAMRDLHRAVDAVGDNLAAIRRQAVGSVERVRDGEAARVEIDRAMAKIRTNSQETHKAVGYIQSIARQTNLLSFNAAIEAAKAGGHGKGFAVLAGEIAKLARHSGDAAREIDGFVSASRDAVQDGETTVAAFTQALAALRGQIDQTAEQVEGIHELAAKQTTTGAQVAAQVEQNDAAAKQTAEAARELTDNMEEFSRTALDLGRLAEQLSGSLNRYRIA